MNELEEGRALRLDWAKLKAIAEKRMEVVPVAVQDAETKEVIVVAYVNQEALEASLASRTATFWSTSRNEPWIKGRTSGNTFELMHVRVNCEQNSLLFTVRRRREGICHTKNRQGVARNCFYRRLNPETMELDHLDP